ncbi:exported hypothetical protein [Gammaproteobacteria bacterium]
MRDPSTQCTITALVCVWLLLVSSVCAEGAAGVPKLVLSGTMIIGSSKVAFLQEGSQGVHRVREGESFAGGEVVSVRRNGITFSFAGRSVEVFLGGGVSGVSPDPRQQNSMMGGAGMPSFQPPGDLRRHFQASGYPSPPPGGFPTGSSPPPPEEPIPEEPAEAESAIQEETTEATTDSTEVQEAEPESESPPPG